MPITSPGLEA
nr:homoserine O-succinyltransferase [Vector pDONR1K18-LBAmetA]